MILLLGLNIIYNGKIVQIGFRKESSSLLIEPCLEPIELIS